ncbi:flagellar basal body-associated FliL family protein [Actinotalea sp. M2MS4P-6]|uniref:flagellar basal body-associated FliL family protein n=1 Tax=Actinotalea sp. M2MS4P-6 TaxID=2983762 RepID=UPI0021E50754|nr:flagellar basal body-associated FliL family protein [Actinotalea sp. M2MS4P-6]MCV2392778.1 flagellar basal body-associated FliL family protein [Actinotalea sp. M2MS4P-6]
MSDKRKIGAKGAAVGAEAAEEVAPKKRSKKKLLLLGAVLGLAVAAGGYYFFLAPSDAATADGATAAAETPAPKPGAVLVVDSVSINLAGGHYLRLGFALQLTSDVTEDPDTARALDLAIDLFSQRPVDEVNDLTSRADLKAELLSELEEAYEGEVMDVYFTDFVTQ